VKGSNIQHKKRQIRAAGEKDAGGDKKLLFCGVYWNSSRHMLSTRGLEGYIEWTVHFSCEQALWLG
jgi:hypothetical protein